MRIQDELLGHSRIESGVSLGRIAERNDRSVDDLGDGQTIMQDSLHQLPAIDGLGRHRALLGKSHYERRLRHRPGNSDIADRRRRTLT
jgi:hypothetical protein